MIRNPGTVQSRFIEAAEEGIVVTVFLKDGTVIRGGCLCNPSQGTGLVIDPITETRVDFDLRDLRKVWLTGRRESPHADEIPETRTSKEQEDEDAPQESNGHDFSEHEPSDDELRDLEKELDSRGL